MNYNSVNTKIRAMKGLLLKHEDYENLISLGNVEQIVIKIREHNAYKNILESIPQNIIYERGLVEQNLTISTSIDFYKIYNFILHYRTKKYLNIYNLQHDIKTLKVIMSSIYDERNIQVDENLLQFNKYSKLNIKSLASSNTIGEVIVNLEGTEFYDVLNTAYKDTTNLFDLNMRLDLYYYIKLWKLQNKYLDKFNKKQVSKINGVEIDIQNILWIYRLIKYYKIKPEFIYTYLIPYHYKISNNEIKTMAQSNSVEELRENLLKTKYKKYFEVEKSLEKVYKEIMKNTYKKSIGLNKNSLVVIINYFYLKKLEVNNLISLLEGVRYKLSPNEIIEYITI